MAIQRGSNNWFTEIKKHLKEYWKDREVGFLIDCSDSLDALKSLMFELQICGAKIKALISVSDKVWRPKGVLCWHIVNIEKCPLSELLKKEFVCIKHWLDKIDPEKNITFLGGVRLALSPLAGRSVYGWQRPEWAKFEDKTYIDENFHRWGINTPPYKIIAPDFNDAVATFHLLNKGKGVILAADSSKSFKAGSEGLSWIKDHHKLAKALDKFHDQTEKLRMAEFIQGIPCSILAMVLPNGVAVFDPIEILTVFEKSTSQLLFCGSSNRWRPGKNAEIMRDYTRLAGEKLAEEVGYRGLFSLDGIWTGSEFFATEINPRHASGLGLNRAVPLFPDYLFNRAIQENSAFIAELDPFQVETIWRDMIRNYSGQDITVLDRDEKHQKVIEIEVNDQMIALGVPSEGIEALIYRPLGQEKLLGNIVAELVSRVSNRHYVSFVDHNIKND
ncbi:hypothetical protein [Xenorhabdus griffiniae]|uniref:ATP-grasp domain-containing protein n=1 Tax=Xenorhabdus griffiniae TaxID=351672 RepID=A0ABY9XGM0_9GAMM|nr:hypothetical protein [Xenorhabdus griffiniae]MBD1227873.1 hypothetical protein [Xenorhabdus griffiniae]MBE8589059.1 hypothetical protein [Xenorhabdus griffiniae]WMV72028.1 hypothetical protein QL128_18230 [Xenorhabdus griffiniae]WNH01706.1 hypothetical protein QL112_018240 [Xenorhabdus griffiniae]